jgi:hypothetical protein
MNLTFACFAVRSAPSLSRPRCSSTSRCKVVAQGARLWPSAARRWGGRLGQEPLKGKAPAILWSRCNSRPTCQSLGPDLCVKASELTCSLVDLSWTGVYLTAHGKNRIFTWMSPSCCSAAGARLRAGERARSVTATLCSSFRSQADFSNRLIGVTHLVSSPRPSSTGAVT